LVTTDGLGGGVGAGFIEGQEHPNRKDSSNRAQLRQILMQVLYILFLKKVILFDLTYVRKELIFDNLKMN
jgi:hypothetical protein